jgi:hypothetical protein
MKKFRLYFRRKLFLIYLLHRLGADTQDGAKSQDQGTDGSYCH